MGGDLLELDCQLTKDGEVVISHDSCLKSTCGVSQTIQELNHDELPEYFETLPVTFGFGLLFFKMAL